MLETLAPTPPKEVPPEDVPQGAASSTDLAPVDVVPAAPAAAVVPPPPPPAMPEEVEYDTLLIGETQIQIQHGAPAEARAAAIEHHITTPEFYKTIDKTTGAPGAWRNAVGNAIRPDDRLATMRKFAADAMPFEGDNFIYTDAGTGKIRLFNPHGLDLGDVPGAAREITIGGAATIGGIFGGPPGAGYAAIGATGLYDTYASMFGETQRSEGFIARTAETVTQGLAAASGQKLGDIAVPVVTNAAKRVLGGGTAKAQAIYDDLIKHNITPTAGTVSGGKGIGRLEGALDQAVASATTMRNSIVEVVETSQKAVVKLAKQIGTPRSQQGTGVRMQEAAEGALQTFAKGQTAIENDLAAKIGDDALFSLDALRGFHAEMKTLQTQLPGFSQKAQGAILESLDSLMSDAAANGGRIPYSAFRQVRTFFGGKMSDMTEGVNRSVYKRMYRAMTEDLEAGATLRGHGDLFEETMAFTRNFKSEYDDVLNKIIDFEAPERGYRSLLNSRRDGGTYFRKLQEQFKPDEWADVSATLIEKMGHKNFGNSVADDSFSINTFLSNWESIAVEAQETLFKGVADGPALRSGLNELVGVFKNVAANARLGNASNTAGAAHALQLMDALGGNFTRLLMGSLTVGGQPALAAGVLASNIGGKIITPLAVSKLITNAGFVKWFAGGPAVRTGAEVGKHIGRLGALYEVSTPQMRGYLDEFIAQMGIEQPDPGIAQ